MFSFTVRRYLHVLHAYHVSKLSHLFYVIIGSPRPPLICMSFLPILKVRALRPKSAKLMAQGHQLSRVGAEPWERSESKAKELVDMM